MELASFSEMSKVAREFLTFVQKSFFLPDLTLNNFFHFAKKTKKKIDSNSNVVMNEQKSGSNNPESLHKIMDY